MNDIHYGHAVGAGIPGAILTTLSQFTDTAWASYLLLSVGVFLLIVAGAILIVCLLYERASILRLTRQAQAITTEQLTLDARARLCDRLQGLSQDQVRIALDNIQLFRVSYRLLDDTPLVYPTDAPYAFYYQFLELSNERELCPVGNWSENSKERRWARQLTDLHIARGEATEAREAGQYTGGSHSARWVMPEIYHKLVSFYLENTNEPPSPTA
jgi:hypothetical protein